MINLIISGLSDLVAGALGFLVEKICEIFGFSFDLFNASFPYAAVAYSYIRSIAVGIALLLATWQLVTFYFGENKSKTSPLRIGLHTIFAVFMIYYGNYILEAIMDIAQSPYNALMGIGTVNLDLDFPVVEAVISSIFMKSGSPLLYLIVLCLVGVQFLRLLLEAIERYVILFGLVYLSPLCSATIATEQTKGIFSRFFSMFISQCILLILNVWSLKMVCSLFDSLPTADVQLLALILGYSFMRFAAKLDSYMGQLGLSVATTGAGLGAEIFASGAAIASMMTGKLVGGKAGGHQNGSGGGTVLGQDQDGFAGNLSHALGMVSPVSGVSQGVQNAAGAAFKTGVSGFSAAGSAFMSTNGNVGEKFSAGVGAFKDKFGENIQDNLRDASMKTQGSNLWARTILKTGNNAIDGMAKSLKDGTVLNSQQLHDLANNPWIAQKLNDQLTASGTEVNDPGVVAAMGMGMIGANNMSPEMMQAYQAGTGAIEAENLNYTSDASGIHQSWSYNGKDNTLDLLNKAQYNQLPTEQQAAFTAYRAANGATMYAAYNSGKTPTDKQKMNRDAQNNIGDFFRSGGTTSLSGSAREGIRSNPAIWSVYQNSLRTTGTRIDSSTPEGAAAIQASVAGIKGLNNQEMRRAQTAAVDHLTRGTYDPDRTYMDGNTISVGWTDADGEYTLAFVTPEGMANMDTSSYTQGNFDTYSMNGAEGVAHYERPLTSSEQAAQELDSLVNPVGNGVNNQSIEESAGYWGDPGVEQDVPITVDGGSTDGAPAEHHAPDGAQYIQTANDGNVQPVNSPASPVDVMSAGTGASAVAGGAAAVVGSQQVNAGAGEPTSQYAPDTGVNRDIPIAVTSGNVNGAPAEHHAPVGAQYIQTANDGNVQPVNSPASPVDVMPAGTGASAVAGGAAAVVGSQQVNAGAGEPTSQYAPDTGVNRDIPIAVTSGNVNGTPAEHHAPDGAQYIQPANDGNVQPVNSLASPVDVMPAGAGASAVASGAAAVIGSQQGNAGTGEPTTQYAPATRENQDIPTAVTPEHIVPNHTVINAPTLSAATRAELKSNPEMVRKVQTDLGKQNSIMQNAPEVAAASLNMLDLKSTPEIRDVRTAINKGIDNGKVVSSQVSAHSSEIVVKDGNREWKMAEMDQQAAQESGMTAPQLAEAGFERVTDKNGAYRYVSATNPMQNAVEKFAQNPTENPIPKEIWAELGQPKNQQYVQQIFSSMEKHGTELKYTPETAETYANVVEAMAPTLQNAGVSKNSILEAASSLRNVEDGMVDARDLSFNGRGLNINHQRGEIENQIVFMTESGVKRVQETNNIRGSDSKSQVESILDNKGYHHINQSGKDYYVLNKGGRIKGNAEQRRFRREKN